MTETTPRSGSVPVKGLDIYYEIHGAGEPLVLLHGAFMTIELMGPLVAGFAKTRRVIAIEQQGHGHTADADRPLDYARMADDTAGVLRHLGIEQADVYGYSMGGGIAVQLAIRHPALVRKLVAVSMSFTSDGLHPEVMATIKTITADLFIGTPWYDAYVRAAPHPDGFNRLVERIKALDAEEYAWPEEEVKAITAPTLVIIGDSDGTRPEHAVEMFRLLGGGVFGDIAGMPSSQLAILPGTNHVGMLERTDLLLAIVPPFLDAPLPAAG